MKKIKIFTWSSAILLNLPVLISLSCAKQEKIDVTKYLVIQAEKDWKSFYQKVVADFTKKESNLLKQNGIEQILIQELGTEEVKNQFDTKGLYHPDSPDLFTLESVYLPSFQNNNYLKVFSSKDGNDFLDTYLNNEQVLQEQKRFTKTQDVIDQITMVNEKLYAVPESMEAMVKFYSSKIDDKDKVRELNSVTEFANLSKVSGYFNNYYKRNFKDIVWSYQENEQTIYASIFDDQIKPHNLGFIDKEEGRQMMEKGFNFMLEAIIDQNMSPAMFQKNLTKAKEATYQYVKKNQDTTAILSSRLEKEILKENIFDHQMGAHFPPSGYVQWGAMNLFGINARVGDKKAQVIEKLISYFYHTNYALPMYQEANKISPLFASRKKLLTLNDPITEAVYYASIKDKPTDPAFNKIDIVNIYTLLIDNFKDTLSTLTKEEKPILAKILTNQFINEIKNKVIALNTLNK